MKTKPQPQDSEHPDEYAKMLATMIAMHALINKDPFPEPARIIAQAREYGEEFINQRGKE